MKTLLTFAAALALVGCTGTTAAPPPSAAAPPSPSLTYSPVSACEQYDLVTLPGQVEVHPAYRTELHPPYPALVRECYVREGQQIAVGATLALLHIPELSGGPELQSKLNDRVKALSERRDLEAAKRKLGVGTGEAVALADADLADAQLALTGWHSKLEAAERSGLVYDKGLFRWQATRGGLISDLTLSVGAALVPERPVLRVWDPDHLEVVVKLPEQQLAAATEPLVLLWQPSGASSPGYELTQSRRDPLVAQETQTLALRFAAPASASQLDFVPGRSGRATLRVPAQANAWRLPGSALCQLEGEDGVFVEVTDGQPMWQPVQILRRGSEQVIVRSAALTSTTRVVSRGVFLLKSARLLEQEG